MGVTPADLLEMPVADLLIAYPAAAHVLIDRGLGCVGCTFAPFETVAEVANVYGIEPQELAQALLAQAVAASGEPDHQGS